MKTTSIVSLHELKQYLTKPRVYLLLHKSGSDQSDCAYSNIKTIDAGEAEITVLSADVNTNRDIHTEYNISSVPSLLEFQEGNFKNVYKGCHKPAVFKALFDEAVYMARMEQEGKVPKHITVYSTPSCSWCTTLKNYLRKNHVRFSEVDISRDPKLSQDLVSRTGQQGVPQTEINGQWVVGFDQNKLDQLLEI